MTDINCTNCNRLLARVNDAETEIRHGNTRVTIAGHGADIICGRCGAGNSVKANLTKLQRGAHQPLKTNTF